MKVSLKSPYVIVPSGGIYSRYGLDDSYMCLTLCCICSSSSLVVVDLGNFEISSNPKKLSVSITCNTVIVHSRNVCLIYFLCFCCVS